MAQEYMNIKLSESAPTLDKSAPKSVLGKLPPRVLNLIICELLEEALKENTSVEIEEGGFVRTDTIKVHIANVQNKIVDNPALYTTDYKVYDLITIGINNRLKKNQKSVVHKRINNHMCYKGYIGITEDYKLITTMEK